MKHKFLKSDIFPIRIELEEDYVCHFVYYANSNLLSKNILISHSFTEDFDDKPEFPIHDIEIKYISSKGCLYNYSVYTSYEDSLAPLQLDRIIIDAVEELNETQTDEAIIEFLERNMNGSAIQYSDVMNSGSIVERTKLWLPFFNKIKEAYINRKADINSLLEELPV